MKISYKKFVEVLKSGQFSKDFTNLSNLTTGPCVGFCLAAVNSSSLEEVVSRFLNCEFNVPEITDLNDCDYKLCTYPGHAYLLNKFNKVVVNTGAPIGSSFGLPVKGPEESFLRDATILLKFISSEWFTPLYFLEYHSAVLDPVNVVNLFYKMVEYRKASKIRNSYGDCLSLVSSELNHPGVFQITSAHKESDGLVLSFTGNAVYALKSSDSLIIESPLYTPFSGYVDTNYFIKEVKFNEIK